MKKVFDVVRSILTWVLLVVAVGVTAFTFISVFTLDKNDRNIAGYKAFIVLSDSMKATDFEAGDVVMVKSVDPYTLKAGDIITFVSKNTESYGQNITHKIREVVTVANGEKAFVTYGTTTDTNDESTVDFSSVIGQYQFRLPKVGKFFNYLKTVPGYICCILIPFLLLIAFQGINTFNVFREYKNEQASALQAEKDELAAERKRAEEMAAELEALKAQMNSQSKE